MQRSSSAFRLYSSCFKRFSPSICGTSFCSLEGDPTPSVQATEKVMDLMRYKQKERGKVWENRLLPLLPLAAFRGDIMPQLVIGPDQLPYFRLSLPNYSQNFQPYSFANVRFMKFVAEKGCGVVIFNSPFAAEACDYNDETCYMLTHGEIVSYHIHKLFTGDPKDQYEIQEKQLHPYNEAQTEWHDSIVPPDTNFVPLCVRETLKAYIETATEKVGRKAKVAMKMDPKLVNQRQPSRILTLNFSPEDFGSAEEAESFLYYVKWFLPPNMSVSLLQSAGMVNAAENDPSSPFIDITSTEYLVPSPVAY